MFKICLKCCFIMFSQDTSKRQPAAVLVLGIYILTLTQHKVKVTPLPLKCGESPDEHGLQHEMGLQTVEPNEILER